MSLALIRISRAGAAARDKPKGLVVECYQERDDLDKAAQKLASEMPGSSKLPFLSLELQVTIIKAAIRKMPAV